MRLGEGVWRVSGHSKSAERRSHPACSPIAQPAALSRPAADRYRVLMTLETAGPDGLGD